MTNDQVFVPKTRSTHPWNLPALDLERENVEGSRVHEEASEEYWELIGDTPIGAFIWCALQLVGLLFPPPDPR
jgi:omega-6 fatty acid desaturase (delta-12 desaturase)